MKFLLRGKPDILAENVSRAWAKRKTEQSGQKIGERERSGERIFQKMLGGERVSHR